MNNSEIIAREYFEAFNNHDVEKGVQMLHPQFSYTRNDGKSIDKEEAIGLDMMFHSAFPDIRLETKHTYTAGNIIINEFLLQGTQKGKFIDIEPTNRKLNLPLCNVLEVRENKIFSIREYFDTDTMMNQLRKQTQQEPEHA